MLQNPLSVPRNFFLLVLLLCTTGVYLLLLLVTVPHLREAAGGMNPLDMMPLGYSSDDIAMLCEALGDSGREYYLSKHLVLDMFYPGMFTVTYTLLIATLQSALGWDSRLNRLLRLAPVLGGLCDYLENINTVVLLKAFPDVPGFFAVTGSVFTIAKTFFSGVALVLFCGLSIALIVRYARLQQRGATPRPST